MGMYFLIYICVYYHTSVDCMLLRMYIRMYMHVYLHWVVILFDGTYSTAGLCIIIKVELACPQH